MHESGGAPVRNDDFSAVKRAYQAEVSRLVQGIAGESKGLNKYDWIKGCATQGPVLAVSTYSSWVFFDASIQYYHSPLSVVHKMPYRLRRILARLSGGAGVFVNALQAADILAEQIDDIREMRSRSSDWKLLLGDTTLLRALKRNGFVFLCLSLSVVSTVPLGVIMYQDGGSIIDVMLTMLSNIPVNYRGIHNLGAYFPIPASGDPQIDALRKGQRILVQHVMSSYQHFLQEKRAVTSEALNAINEGVSDNMSFFLNLHLSKGMVRSKPKSCGHVFLDVLFVILFVAPQIGYVLDAYRAGQMIESDALAAPIILLILNAIIYAGLSLDAAFETAESIASRQKSIYSYFVPYFSVFIGFFLGIVGLFSGATAASANLSTMMDGYGDPNATALVHPPKGVVRGFEVTGFIADGSTNGFYGRMYILLLARWAFMAFGGLRHPNDLKILKLDEAVKNYCCLILNMNPENFKQVINMRQHKGRLHELFSDSTLRKDEVNAMFAVSDSVISLMGDIGDGEDGRQGAVYTV